MRTVKEYIDFYENLTETMDLKDDSQWEDYISRMQHYFKNVDFYDFSWQELLKIGFSRWDEEGKILLIPEYFFCCIKEGTLVESINGEKKKFNKEKMDNDSRFGFLAYGIIKEEVIARVGIRRDEHIKIIEDDENE